jgi:hypothetical protein
MCDPKNTPESPITRFSARFSAKKPMLEKPTVCGSKPYGMWK